LRSRGELCWIPVIAATGFRDVLLEVLDAGVDDIVMKPVPLAELMIRVKALLKVRHLENDLERATAYTRELRESPFHPNKPRS
jgi:DNA-binding response OmpR family regulator